MALSNLSIAKSNCVAGATLLAVLLTISCSSPSDELNQSLKTFAQSITTTTTLLDLKPGQQIAVPVVITNSGQEIWSPKGQHPVTLSYRWIQNDEVLSSIEGQRTLLPQVLKPGQSLSTQVQVIAPQMPGQFSLGLSMVQEGVTWFATAPGGGGWIKIPVRVQ
jgi:hypothetical protein